MNANVVLLPVAAVAAGLVGGVYAAFSVMVMPALRRRPHGEAASAMIEVNRVAERGPFIALFAIAAVSAVGVAVVAAPRGGIREIAVASASLASTVLTILANVPLNRRLERDGARFWPEYARRWTRWNTVRAVLAAAAVAFATTSSADA